MKDGEKKADTLAILKVRNHIVVSSLGFIYARFDAGEASNPETPSVERKSPK